MTTKTKIAIGLAIVNAVLWGTIGYQALTAKSWSDVRKDLMTEVTVNAVARGLDQADQETQEYTVKILDCASHLATSIAEADGCEINEDLRPTEMINACNDKILPVSVMLCLQNQGNYEEIIKNSPIK